MHAFNVPQKEIRFGSGLGLVFESEAVTSAGVRFDPVGPASSRHLQKDIGINKIRGLKRLHVSPLFRQGILDQVRETTYDQTR